MGERFAKETVRWCGKVWNWGNQNGSKLLMFSYCEATGPMTEEKYISPSKISSTHLTSKGVELHLPLLPCICVVSLWS